MRIENTGFGDIKLIQDPNGFCYGIDAVILADFASKICRGWETAADLGTGTGIVPFILIHKNDNRKCHTVGIDIQQGPLRMAENSAAINCMQEKAHFFKADISDIAMADGKDALKEISCDDVWRKSIKDGGFDMVVSNPPYVTKGSGLANKNDGKFIARHETSADLECFIKAAAKILKTKGNFFLVHRPSRLVDVFYLGRKYGLEPKTMRVVLPREGKEPNIVLVHCVKGGGRELKVLNDMIVYRDSGVYSEEIEEIYERKK